jgi:hypothetical protein
MHRAKSQEGSWNLFKIYEEKIKKVIKRVWEGGKDLTGFCDSLLDARLGPRAGYEGLATQQNLSGL